MAKSNDAFLCEVCMKTSRRNPAELTLVRSARAQLPAPSQLPPSPISEYGAQNNGCA
jgi:hypothetical protein